MKFPSLPLFPIALAVLAALTLGLFALPGPDLDDYRTLLLDASFDASSPQKPNSLHREILFHTKALPPGALLTASVELIGGPDISAFLENGPGALSRKKGVQPPALPSSRFQTWEASFVVPAGPGPLAFTLAWKASPPTLKSLALSEIDSRYFLLRDGLHFLRFALLLGTLVAALLFVRRRLGTERFRILAGRKLLPLALIAVIAVGVTGRWDRGHGFNGLCGMGSVPFSRATPAAHRVDFKVASLWGYDGLQYAQLSLDPLLLDRDALRRALDAPAYRAKRILLPAVAWVVGLGHAPWVIQAYSLLNVAAWALLLLVLRRAFPAPTLEEGAAMAAILLSVGTLESIRRALTDLPATALLAAALHLAERGANRPRLPLLFSAAVLTRESLLLALPALLRNKPSRAFLFASGIGLLVVGDWFAYVTFRFPGPLSQTTHNFSWPLVAHIERLAEIPRNGGWGDGANRATCLALVSLFVQAAFLVRHPRPASVAWRAGILYVPLLLCLGQPVLEEYYAAARALLPLTLVFHWELARTKRGRAFWFWAVPANLFLWDGLVKYLFTSG